MSTQSYTVQEKTPFSKSLIWQINKDFYQENGIAAWSDNIVPHMITNSSMTATAYAELIYALLEDIDINESTDKVVYILELGAGHGRLCFNILEHLEKLMEANECKKKYCYVLSDIVEENLSFLSKHPKLKKYYESGVLDLSYFDATESTDLVLRNSNKTLTFEELDHPILTIANYFFDSLPNELFYIQDKNVFECSVSIESAVDPKGESAIDLINDMKLTYHKSLVKGPVFKNEMFNEILSQYAQTEEESYVLFPKAALECLANISSLSKAGLVLLTIDKGYKEIQEILGLAKPDLVNHGSFSLWVNFHAMSQFCLKNGGHSMFDPHTNFSIEFICLFFTKQTLQYNHFEKMFLKHSRQLSLDDFNSIKKLLYKNIGNATLSEILGFVRLSSYDSAIFIKLLPSIKKRAKQISVRQRSRLKQTMHQVWLKHYTIKDDYDLSYEMGGLMYDLGYYLAALDYFNHSTEIFGHKIDVYYNQILCYYQLREDEMFHKTLNEAKLKFPNKESLKTLENLDMS